MDSLFVLTPLKYSSTYTGIFHLWLDLKIIISGLVSIYNLQRKTYDDKALHVNILVIVMFKKGKNG